MRLLCTELAHRIGVDRKAWSRRAAKLTLQIISLKSGSRYARIMRVGLQHHPKGTSVCRQLKKWDRGEYEKQTNKRGNMASGAFVVSI